MRGFPEAYCVSIRVARREGSIGAQLVRITFQPFRAAAAVRNQYEKSAQPSRRKKDQYTGQFRV